jgi:TolB-like protein
MLKIDPKEYIEDYEKRLVITYRNKSDRDRIIDALRKAGYPEHPPLPLPDKPSIAVLPFTNMSDDPKQEYFADGMTDDLITDLSKISGLFVISRNSAFKYKGQTVDVKKVSRELGVRHILEGSVRRAGDQVRINAQLIDAATDGHLWAERYDGKMDDIFALQDKITRKIVTALAVQLTESDRERAARKYTNNVAAYDAYLLGREHLSRYTPDDFAKALYHYQKAIELDPNYGLAYAGIAHIYYHTRTRGKTRKLGVTFQEARLLAHKYSQLAMKNPNPWAHRINAYLNLSLRLYEKAISEAERAIALDPNNASMHRCMSLVLTHAGRPKEGIEYAKRAMRLDPRSTHWSLAHFGVAHFCLGQYEKAVTFLERAIARVPEFRYAIIYLAASYGHLGRDQKARAAFDKYKKLGGSLSVLRRMILIYFRDPEVADRCAQGLIKAGFPEPHEYYKVIEKNMLTEENIEEIVFGRRVSGIDLYTGKQWSENITKEGKFERKSGSHTYKGTYRIEEGVLIKQYQKLYKGLKIYGTVFRNPEGTPEKKDEYLIVTGARLSTFSVED